MVDNRSVQNKKKEADDSARPTDAGAAGAGGMDGASSGVEGAADRRTAERDRVYRSTLSVITAWAVIVVAGIMLVDALLRGAPSLWVVAGPGLVAAAVAAWAFVYRPCLRLGSDELVLVGPMREIVVPYGSVRDVRVRAVVAVDTPSGTYSARAGPERNRRFKGRDHADEASDIIRRRAAEVRDGEVREAGISSASDAGEVRVRLLWLPWAVCFGLAAVSIIAGAAA